MKPPDTRYARSGEVRIAYQVVGQGPIDLVFVPGFISNLEVHWEDPGYAHLLQRALHAAHPARQAGNRVVRPRRRARDADARNAHGRPARGDGRRGQPPRGAARHLRGRADVDPVRRHAPERTRALVLYGGYAHFHTFVMPPQALERFVDDAQTTWGSGATLAQFAPGRVDDPRFAAWWARFERLSASPTAAITLARMNAQIDVRGVLRNCGCRRS
jgi:hypothetical protein